MSSRTNRFFASLLRILRVPGRTFPVKFRRSKSGAPSGAAPCDRSHSTLATPSINNDSLSSADTPSSEGFHTPPAVGIGCLPFELLCDCLADLGLDELLPLRLVSKTWLAAVNTQEEYSRYIDYLPEDMPSDEYDEWAELRRPGDDRCRYSIDLLKARLTCSSRPISLRVVTSTLSESDTTAVSSLISEHLQRIELLFLELAPTSAASLFRGMKRPAPMLRVLTLQVRGGDFDGPAVVPSDFCSGHAPLLESASLTNAVFEPANDCSCPAFSSLKFFHLFIDSDNCVGLALMLAQCPDLEALSVEIDGWPQGRYLPANLAPILGLKSLRLVSSGDEAAELDLVSAMTHPTMEHVSMPLNRLSTLRTLFVQLRGLGPLTFRVYNDLFHVFGRTHIQLISKSTKRVRGIELNYDDHWFRGWSGVCILKDLTACALTEDITIVHLSLLQVGYCALQLISSVFGQWTAVRTVRIDVLGGRLSAKEKMHGEFPELVQLVLFHPHLAPDAGESEVADICTKSLLVFFSHSKTDTVTVVLTRDEETADLVTTDPSAAENNLGLPPVTVQNGYTGRTGRVRPRPV